MEIEIIDENVYLSHDDSSMMEDDVDKDPDWKKTPLYNRIQKLQVILYYRYTHIEDLTRLKEEISIQNFCYQEDKCKT